MAGNKKKSASKRKAAAKSPKYVIPPASPIRTRSGSGEKSAAASIDVATPTVSAPPPGAASDGASSYQSDIAAMEKRLDARFDKMETSFRSSLTQMAASSLGSASAPKVKTVTEATVQAEPVAAASAALPVSSDKKKSRSASTSSSSSSDFSADWDSSRSSSSSRSRSSSSRRGHRHHSTKRSSKRRSRSSSKPKHSKYSSARYLKENEKVKTYQRLVLVNVRMSLALLKRKNDIKGVLRHMLFIAEKGDKDVFIDEALIEYDESIKESAKESSAKRFNARKPSMGRPTQAVGHCIKFNYDHKGCLRGKDCFYLHACSACGSTSHGNKDCSKRPSQK